MSNDDFHAIADDSLTDDANNVGEEGDKKEENELLKLEEETTEEERVSEPKGLRNSDPGVNDEEALDGEMWGDAVEADTDKEDIEKLGFHIEGGETGELDDFEDTNAKSSRDW